MQISQREWTLHDLRGARVFMARIEDQAGTHHWRHVIVPDQPITATRDGRQVELRFFTVEQGGILKPHQEDQFGTLLDAAFQHRASTDAIEYTPSL